MSEAVKLRESISKREAKRIEASKELQKKVGTGTIDAKKIAKAQDVIKTTKVDFAELARPDMDKIQKAIDDAKRDMLDHDAVMQSFKQPIMNLKANAGTFDYEFVSQLTGMVLMFLENIEKPDRKIIQIVDILHKTILLALAYNMSGDGGENGKTLLGAFDQVCKKYKPAS